MTNLFAFCRIGDQLQVKRVVISQDVQEKIAGIFAGQQAAFLDGVTEEIQFGTDWKPDADEVLVMDAPAEALSVLAVMTGDVLAIPTINAANFIDEGIKALAVVSGPQDNPRILIQLFTAQQVLSRRFALMFTGDTFRELTEPAFTLDNYLVAVLENNRLKFKSYFLVKRVFQLSHLYQEATDQQIEAFCAHDSLHIPDIAAFKEIADQPMRRLVHAIHRSNVLTQHAVADIASKAQVIGMEIAIIDGKIAFPAEKKLIKHLLRFLDDGIYEAPLTARRYMTNSKTPYGQ